MNQLELLWEYQLADVEADNLNRAIKRSPKRLRLLKLRESLQAQQNMLREIEEEIVAMLDRTDVLKDAVLLAEEQLRQLHARIQESPVRSSDDARAFLVEAQRMLGNLDEYEMETKRIRKNAADRDRRQRDIKLRAVRNKAEFDELRLEYEAEYKEKSAELEKLRAAAEEKLRNIEAVNIERYRAIKLRCVPAMAKLTNGQCGGCNMSFPSSVLQDIRAGKLVECETCGRMILG